MPPAKFDDHFLSQPEARLVADFLRVRYALTVRNAFMFWRKKPTEVVAWVKATYPEVHITAEKIAEAAGRTAEVVHG
jgi:hypothetical protein